MFRSKYKYFQQLDLMDCGPTCIKMIASFYGKEYSLDFLRTHSFITKNGVSLNGISHAAKKIGFKTLPVKVSYEELTKEIPLPCILHWNQGHFVVLYDTREKKNNNKKEKLVIADPAHGLMNVDKETVLKCWKGYNDKGVALLLEPTSSFYENSEYERGHSVGFDFLYRYVRPYRKYFLQIFIGLILISLINTILPFLTQSLVDYGIQKKDLSFINLILSSQLFLFLGVLGIEMVRHWILLHMNTRLSVSIISDFLNKLMKLPISFFESKHIGDISQRISDHNHIEEFLTGSFINTMFSLVNLLIFSLVLSSYNLKLFTIFFLGSSISIGWVFLFSKERRRLDYNRFQTMSDNQASIYELITGMQEIKLNSCEQVRKLEWQKGQVNLFDINMKSLRLGQYQELGSSFLTQLKNILISYFSATLVINNQLTLGAMLSISYIIGQMNNPLNQIMEFAKKIQEAKLSLDRLGEIHSKPNEEIEQTDRNDKILSSQSQFNELSEPIPDNLVENKGILFKDVSFRYGGPTSRLVLKNINLLIPEGKITAIVGASGSGKTTLLKLFLKFYSLENGMISINGRDIREISAKEWRKQCGTVMQDGFIFSDTIAKNIAVDGQLIDDALMENAIKIACIDDYISHLPLGLNTKIGNTGTGLSGGQRQRLFIARAVYKNPKYIFFDEATSALDSKNESSIMENLNYFLKGKTSVVIAHRLSTVKTADQIIVLHNGEIVEIGTHSELVCKGKFYYELIKNQLEFAL